MGGLEVVDGGCDVVVDGVEDVCRVLLVLLDDVVGGVDEVLDCEVDDGGKVAEEETEAEVEDVESVAEAVEVGLLLAIELDDESEEELAGVDTAWEDVADVEEPPVSVLVELEDIVNCLNLRSLGLLYIAMSAMNAPILMLPGAAGAGKSRASVSRRKVWSFASYLKPGSTSAEQRTAGLGGKGKGER